MISDPLNAPKAAGSQQVERLRQVMACLRRECPWDAEQTHRSLVTYLIEETAEVVDAIEVGNDADLREELGDLLLQVVFHSEIAEQQGRFSLDDVAHDIAEKLIRRHPYVFADAEVPTDLRTSWEARKRAEKGRTSALDGIPDSLDPIARAQKVLSRASQHGVIDLGSPPQSEATVGDQIVALIAQAQAQGLDADQLTRDAVRRLEARVRAAEANFSVE